MGWLLSYFYDRFIQVKQKQKRKKKIKYKTANQATKQPISKHIMFCNQRIKKKT